MLSRLMMPFIVSAALGCVKIPRCESSQFHATRMISDGGQANIYLTSYRGKTYVEKRFTRYRSFLVEQEALSCLPRKPSIVKAICQDPERQVIILERVRGEKPARLSASQLRELIMTIALIHRAGYIHGDVKPSNIIMKPNGSIVLIDFGLARKKGRLNGRFGTSGYMAPEVSVGGAGHNESIDWWSLGIVAKNLLTMNNSLTRDLIGRMLERDPSRRLARCRNLPNHPLFFKGD